MNELPKFFYKYRSINKGLNDDLSLNALFNNKAIFSNRKSFNDPFDSKLILKRKAKMN